MSVSLSVRVGSLCFLVVVVVVVVLFVLVLLLCLVWFFFALFCHPLDDIWLQIWRKYSSLKHS